MKHVLFILTSTETIGTANHKCGYEFSEVADPYIEFIKQGFTVDFASVSGGTPPEVGFNPSHQNSKEFRESNGFKRLNFSHKLADVNPGAYDAIFFPGGLGPMVDMVDNVLVKETIKKVYESDKIVGAVCHGPVALLNVRLSNGQLLTEGKKLCSFTEAEEKVDKHHLGAVIPFLLDQALIDQGGKFSKAQPFESHVVVDGNLVTGQNPASASGVAIEMINLLQSINQEVVPQLKL